MLSVINQYRNESKQFSRRFTWNFPGRRFAATPETFAVLWETLWGFLGSLVENWKNYSWNETHICYLTRVTTNQTQRRGSGYCRWMGNWEKLAESRLSKENIRKSWKSGKDERKILLISRGRKKNIVKKEKSFFGTWKSIEIINLWRLVIRKASKFRYPSRSRTCQ